MAVLPNARANGLSQTVGRPASNTTWLAVGIGAAAAVACGYMVLLVVAALAALVCGMIARAKLGGQTGDIVGATQQITELAALVTIVAMLT
jgi:adenosylcobinamide-GDP ribazoletransferase